MKRKQSAANGPARGPKYRVIREKRGLQNHIYKIGQEGIVESEKRSSASVKAPFSASISVKQRFVLLWLYIREFFSSFFLPEGYPDSVSSDYLSYQLWDTIQALCSSLTGLLSTKAVLQGYGVGNAEATAASATVQWIFRSGTGMLTSLSFAWWQGTKLGQREKFFRLLADVLCDIGTCLELISPMFASMYISFPRQTTIGDGSDMLFGRSIPTFHYQTTPTLLLELGEGEELVHVGPWAFLILACLGSLCKAIVGVTGSATRAFLTQHQAKRDNLADVAAKDGSQETAVNLLGLVIGLIITPLLEDRQFWVIILFAWFTAIHLFANYRAVRCVVMDTLNRSRAILLVNAFFDSQNMLSPQDANRLESLFQTSNWKQTGLYLGCRFSEFFSGSFPTSTFLIQPVTPFLLRVDRNKNRFSIYILFHESATDIDVLRAYFYAECIRNTLEQRRDLFPEYEHKIFTIENEPPVSITRDLSAFFNQFIAKAKISGWNCSGLSLGESGWRTFW